MPWTSWRQAPPGTAALGADLGAGKLDHAAGFFKYLTEILTGIPCASVGASVVSVYGTKFRRPRCA